MPFVRSGDPPMPRPRATTPAPAPAPRARPVAEPNPRRARRLFLVRETAAAYGGATDREAADAHALEELGDAIVTLASHIHAATHRLLVLIAEFDHRRGWERDGHRSCAHWLAFRTGIDLGAAREKVRTARVLAELPRTSASMARGELSFSQARALTRIASPTNEAELLELARGVTVHHLERMVRGWKGRTRQDEAERERANHAARSFSIFPDADGTYVVRGRLEPEVAAVLMKAVEAASDALFHGDRRTGRGAETRAGGASHRARRSDDASRREAAQRRADAMGLLAERALAAGFGGAEGEDAPLSGSRAERYQVVLHVDAEGLAADGDGGGQRALEDGTRVSGETSRRLSCDASVVRVTHAPDGSVLDVGRRTRSIPPALRRALETRDRGCRFPGCGSRFTEAHHVRHWVEGGATSLSNTVLACRFHHRLLHEGGWRATRWGEGRVVFVDPHGGEHFEGGWQPPSFDPDLDSDPVEALLEDHRRRGIAPDWRTAGARWKRERDVPHDVWAHAMESLG